MFNVYADTKKNRLYLTLDDITDSNIPDIIKTMSKEVDKLTKNFTCLVDIRSLRLSFNENETDYLGIVQGALKDSGMSEVVRVIGQDTFNKFTHQKMNEQSRSVGYKATSVATLKEAEDILDKYM